MWVELTDMMSYPFHDYAIFLYGKRDYLCGSNNHMNTLKAESFPWLVSEEVREITSMRKVWCTVPGLRGLCGEKCGWFLEAEHSPSWQPAGEWLLQSCNCKALNPTSSRNELEINLWAPDERTEPADTVISSWAENLVIQYQVSAPQSSDIMSGFYDTLLSMKIYFFSNRKQMQYPRVEIVWTADL